MLGLGWTEMLVVGVVALIVIGPKDLPVVMNRIGKIVGQIRRMGSEFQRELNKTTGLDEVRNLRNSITEPLRKTSDEIRREFNTMTPSGPKPSGLIKPADPASESVVDEIKAAAGIAPVEPDPVMLPAASPAQATASSTTSGAPPKASGSSSNDGRAASEDKPKRNRSKPVPALPAEPADSPAAPVRKKPARVRKAPADPDALPTEPADSPATPAPKVRRPRTPKPADQQTPENS